jgi:hypothetical protein
MSAALKLTYLGRFHVTALRPKQMPEVELEHLYVDNCMDHHGFFPQMNAARNGAQACRVLNIARRSAPARGWRSSTTRSVTRDGCSRPRCSTTGGGNDAIRWPPAVTPTCCNVPAATVVTPIAAPVRARICGLVTWIQTRQRLPFDQGDESQ